MKDLNTPWLGCDTATGANNITQLNPKQLYFGLLKNQPQQSTLTQSQQFLRQQNARERHRLRQALGRA